MTIRMECLFIGIFIMFDPGRFGNQGLFAARGLMAMGIYLDNDTMYDRGYRYLACLPGRKDDLPYQADLRYRVV